MLKRIVALTTVLMLVAAPVKAEYYYTDTEYQFFNYIEDHSSNFDPDSQDFYLGMGRLRCSALKDGTDTTNYSRLAQADLNGAVANSIIGAINYLCPEYRNVLPESLRTD